MIAIFNDWSTQENTNFQIFAQKIFMTHKKTWILPGSLLHFCNISQMQPVGLGNPAILQPCLPGPYGNNS